MTEPTTEQHKKAREDAAAFVLGKLSEREVQVFLRVVRGESLAEIAEALDLSHSSVSTYRNRVLAKLRQRTDADLVLLAQYLGFVTYGGEQCDDS